MSIRKAQLENGAPETVVRETLRPDEVAGKLGISTATVIRLLKRGQLPGMKIGRLWLIRRAALECFLRQLQTVPPETDNNDSTAQEPTARTIGDSKKSS